MKFKNAEEIRAAFIKSGWNSDITFTEISGGSYEENQKKYGHFIAANIKNGGKFFKMGKTGNVFDDAGKIAFYNIQCGKD